MNPQLLFSPALAHVPHAFSTRVGGISRGIFSSLNFGNPGDLAPHERDTPDSIARNIDLVLNAINAPGRELVQVHQVHGGDILLVRPGQPAHASPDTTKADAIVTDDPTRILAVRVADCAPILLASRDGRVVAAVHAGWRGVIAGIAPRAIAAMRTLGASDISAAVGPCLCADNFEIADDVARQFRAAFPDHADILRPGARPGKFQLDMKKAIERQLANDGSVSEISVLPHCTAGAPDLFFSHRRDAGRTGRMIGIIGPAA
ncbi:MAG: peptidoglycan editing factor PgeF [Planctomycetes bacterium]|nr:peptidoglycan editing factor PgeF [Planctomycetota bacterium]